MRLKLLYVLAGFVAPMTASGASLQERYNAAQAAFDAGQWAEARTGFAVLLPTLDANPRTMVQAAVVRARMGTAALALGEHETAAAILARAATRLPPGSEEWQRTTLDFGRAQEVMLDYEKAAAAYRAALATPLAAGDRLAATAGMVRVLTFSDPAAARRFADDALVQAQEISKSKRGDGLAQLQTLRGRIELNDGNPREARKWFDKAVASAGGLGARVNVADVRVRADLALAAYQTGDLESARRYLAYTGAGSLPEQGFELGADMPLPGCAPTGPVARDDMAIIEFTLAEDGRVSSVTPIYTTRRGGPELAFARAVRTWSWRPAAAKALPAFWRQSVRLELRCVSRSPNSNRWGPGAAAEAWLVEQAPEPMPDTLRGEAAALPLLKTELTRRTAAFGALSPQLLPVLIAIYSNAVSSPEDSVAAATTGLAIAKASAAPQDLIIYFRMAGVIAEESLAAAKRKSKGPRTSEWFKKMAGLLAALDAEGLGGTRGAALIAGYLGQSALYAKEPVAMVAAYRRVLATPAAAMPDGDPLRQIARLQLASYEAASARPDVARSLLAATGLTPEQCSAFPVTPLLKGTGASSQDFPPEVLKWNFEGTVRVAYDLDEAGRTVGVRTVIASPPLIFSAATERMARGFRYQPIFRDGAAIACADQQYGVKYRVAKF